MKSAEQRRAILISFEPMPQQPTCPLTVGIQQQEISGASCASQSLEHCEGRTWQLAGGE